MSQSLPLHQHSVGLVRGEWVIVRSEREILSTLDAEGRLDGLPFMPEMLQYCGRRLRVGRRAHKTCDTIQTYMNRRMHNAVHLEDVTCDGSAHDQCGAACPIFWKEAWLKRDPSAPRGTLRKLRSRIVSDHPAPQNSTACSRATIEAQARQEDHDGDTRYVCQATELRKATVPLGRFEWRQYVQDLVSGNVTLGFMLNAAFFALLRKSFKVGPGFRIKHRLYRALQRAFNGPPIIHEWGTLEKTPTVDLHLKRGDTVRVKPYNEIVRTLSKSQRNRGMWFDDEMLPYCGGTYRVLSRVERIVDEKTGKMLPMKNSCIILEGVVCRAACSKHRLFCPRQLYPFWREIWLQRTDSSI